MIVVTPKNFSHENSLFCLQPAENIQYIISFLDDKAKENLAQVSKLMHALTVDIAVIQEKRFFLRLNVKLEPSFAPLQLSFAQKVQDLFSKELGSLCKIRDARNCLNNLLSGQFNSEFLVLNYVSISPERALKIAKHTNASFDLFAKLTHACVKNGSNSFAIKAAEEGFKCFVPDQSLIVSAQRHSASMKQYYSAVDLLTQEGLKNEANAIIEKMPHPFFKVYALCLTKQFKEAQEALNGCGSMYLKDTARQYAIDALLLKGLFNKAMALKNQIFTTSIRAICEHKINTAIKQLAQN